MRRVAEMALTSRRDLHKQVRSSAAHTISIEGCHLTHIPRRRVNPCHIDPDWTRVSQVRFPYRSIDLHHGLGNAAGHHVSTRFVTPVFLAPSGCNYRGSPLVGGGSEHDVGGWAGGT